MKINTNISEINNIKEHRDHNFPDVFSPPSHWQDPKYSEFDPNKQYTLSKNHYIKWVSTFGRNPMLVEILLHGGQQTRINDAIVCASKASKWINNIRLNGAGICEHILALWPWLGIQWINYRLSGANNFPSFSSGLDGLLQKIKPDIVEVWLNTLITVEQPVMCMFHNWEYIIIEPDDGSRRLVIDHAFSYWQPSLGNQRVKMEITPTSFAYLATARPVSIGLKTKVGQYFLKKLWFIPWFGLNEGNVVFADKNKIINPNTTFIDEQWINREPIMHEIIDKLWALWLLPGKFVWKITVFRTSHAQDVDAINRISTIIREIT
jgi:UDP-3-O-acyl-N-acetylglucosamine deacetylase